MRIVGVDYGRRRIGVASADADGGIASGLCVIDRERTPNAAQELFDKIGDDVSAIVFGLPLGANDEETEMSLEVREFAKRVEELLARRDGGHKIEIFFYDESFTSIRAAEISMHRKKKARRDKSIYDRIAACLILQNFIDDRA